MALSPVQTMFRVPLQAAGKPLGSKVELLAPAGSFDALVAAVENGADAVYLAGQHFGARKFAANFSDDELRRGIDFAHVRGVKVFVTVNTLVFDDEFEGLVPFLELIREAGADAVIVQDLGVMRVLREAFSDLPLHISTQATVHNSLGVRWLKDLGAERVILAREMTLKDIAGMKEKTGAELETFVHGALCYCYSGQCLMSSVIGERSGNRGACAYTCRLPFDMKENGATMEDVRQKHVLSSKDLNQIESIPKLIESGVTSFKIEGRMKRPEYVAVVTRAYRNAIDRYYAGEFHITDAEHDAILRVFNREFTPGYLEGKEKWAFTSWDTSGNRGTPLGEVMDSGPGWVRVKLLDQLSVKDGIVILHMPTWGHEKGGEPDTDASRASRDRRSAPDASYRAHRYNMHDDAPEEYGFTVSQITHGGRWVTDAAAGMTVELKGEQRSSPGDKIYKTADHDTLESARASFAAPTRKVHVEMDVAIRPDAPIHVTVRDTARDVTIEHGGFVAQIAQKAPLSDARVREQFAKVTDSVFDAKLRVKVEGAAFAPLSELNAARRDALAKLETAIAARYHRAPRGEGTRDPGAGTRSSPVRPSARVARPLSLAVNCWRKENALAALDAGAMEIYFSGLKVGGLQPKWDEDALHEVVAAARAKGAKVWLASGMIQKDWEVEALRHAVKATGLPILAGNHGACLVAKEEGVPFVADWPMNVYNSVTVDWLVEHGAERITLSPELTLAQMGDVARHTDAPLEALGHGRLTLMTSEYCSIGHATKCQMPGGTWAPCHDAEYSLQDRLGKRFPLETDGGCRMYILNSVELAMLNRLGEMAENGLDVVRIESIGTKPDALAAQIGLYRQALARPGHALEKGEWKALEATCPDGFTTGHFYRGPA